MALADQPTALVGGVRRGPSHDRRANRRGEDIEGSLERNVNALAAVGYELTAIAGGDPGVLDLLLKPRPYAAGLVDHAGLTLAVMARPIDRPVIAREYRLLHTRIGFGVDLGYPMLVDINPRTGEVVYKPGMVQAIGQEVSFCPARAGSRACARWRTRRGRGPCTSR